jgi:formylglycine-generating enzyme required for sulfatase activity
MRYLMSVIMILGSLGFALACGSSGGERAQTTAKTPIVATNHGKFTGGGGGATGGGTSTSTETSSGTGTSTGVSGGTMTTIPASGTAASFRVDVYEAHLAENGASINSKDTTPITNVDFTTAKTACARSGKRLCHMAEWVRACKGDKNQLYGMQDNSAGLSGVCDVARTTGDGSGTPKKTGVLDKCKPSGYEVHDMIGGVSEWILSDDSGPMIAGGSFNSPVENATCESMLLNTPGSSTPLTGAETAIDIGFRCCADL